jgi:ElaB/YqjD/DUF883 family membrane-anchored ribosome-binding protein
MMVAALRLCRWDKLVFACEWQPGRFATTRFPHLFLEPAMDHTSKDKLITDMKLVLTDVEDLLKAATAATGETAAALREKAAGKLKLATEKLTGLQEAALLKGKEAAKVTDEYVHANPWKAVGIAAAAGFLIGLLINRK